MGLQKLGVRDAFKNTDFIHPTPPQTPRQIWKKLVS